MKVRSIRGFHDILPDKIKRWHHIEERAKSIFELYGFSEIRIPIVEFTDIYARSLGTSTDIVEKEMYTFTDRDGSSITLRPEGTAGVVRAFIENSLHIKSPVHKLYYMGMMFRHERPQKGRQRGFCQIGAELFGSNEPLADVDLIIMLWRFLESVGITEDLKLEISSLGDLQSRTNYKDKLKEFFISKNDLLCQDCVKKLDSNPLRILDCKKKECKKISDKAPAILDFLSDQSKEHFEDVKAGLSSMNVPFVINPRIIRGLDYYTDTVFEITTDKLGSQNAVAAGGRYNGLVEELGGTSVPAVGFAAGVERIVLLHANKYPEGFKQQLDVFIACLGKEAHIKGLSIAYKLRKNGVYTEIEYDDKSLKSQLKRADKLDSKYTIIIGDEEINKGKAKVRHMNKGLEEEIKFSDISKLPLKFRV